MKYLYDYKCIVFIRVSDEVRKTKCQSTLTEPEVYKYIIVINENLKIDRNISSRTILPNFNLKNCNYNLFLIIIAVYSNHTQY